MRSNILYLDVFYNDGTKFHTEDRLILQVCLSLISGEVWLMLRISGHGGKIRCPFSGLQQKGFHLLSLDILSIGMLQQYLFRRVPLNLSKCYLSK